MMLFSFLAVILFVIVVAFVYFIPTMIAFHKKRKNKEVIFLANALVGWTAVGWILVFLWSLFDGEKILAPSNNAAELEKFFELKEKGVITEEEFETKKKELLS